MNLTTIYTSSTYNCFTTARTGKHQFEISHDSAAALISQAKHDGLMIAYYTYTDDQTAIAWELEENDYEWLLPEWFQERVKQQILEQY